MLYLYIIINIEEVQNESFKKIMIPVITGMIILGMVALFLSINTFDKFGKREIEDLRSAMISEKTEKLKNLVELAYSMVSNVYQRMDLSDAEKQAAAMDLIKNIRYGEENYLWINDMRPYMVMHPITTTLDGKDLSDYKDANGKLLFVEMKNICEKDGEGTVDYYWAKPGFEKPVPKLSYVKLFKKWDLVIVTGIYIEDVDAAVSSK